MNDYSQVMAFVRAVYGADRRLTVVPYGYTVQFGAVAAGATVTQTLGITANADFVHLRTSFHAVVGTTAQLNATVPVPLIRLLITDSGTNEQFTNAPTDLTNYGSKNTDREKDHCFPRIIAGRSSLALVATSYDSANYSALDLYLEGVLVRVL